MHEDAGSGNAASFEVCAGILSDLVRLQSWPGEEAAMAHYIGHWFEQRGIPFQYQAVEGDRINVIARVDGHAPGKSLVLLSHLDTTTLVQGWHSDPLIPKLEGDRLYGLGSCDMKGGVVSNMLAVAALHQNRDAWKGTVYFAGVVDEEAYSKGCKQLLASGLHADMALVPEPHFDDVLLGAVGKVLVKAEILGRSAHGSTPELGVNAVTEAARLLVALDQLPMGEHPLIGRESQCVLGIKGGPDAYVILVPERCEFTINRHIVPGQTGESVLDQMEQLATGLKSPASFRFSIEPPYYPPFLVSQEEPLVQAFAEAHRAVLGRPPDFQYGRGVSDANYMVADAGVPTVTFGPKGANLHGPDEWVSVSSMESVVDVYLRTALALLQ